MSTFTVKIDCDNDAFDGPTNCEQEICRILRGIVKSIEREGFSGFYETVRDVNGNDVGRWALKASATGNPEIPQFRRLAVRS